MQEATPTQEVQLKLLAIEMEMENSLDKLTEAKSKISWDFETIQTLKNQVIATLKSKPVDVEKVLKSVESLNSKCNSCKRDVEVKGFKMTDKIDEFLAEQYETIGLIKNLLKSKK